MSELRVKYTIPPECGPNCTDVMCPYTHSPTFVYIVLSAPTKSSPIKKTTIGCEFTPVVHAVTDGVPGTYHDPEDLMNEISRHSYVQSVDLID